MATLNEHISNKFCTMCGGNEKPLSIPSVHYLIDKKTNEVEKRRVQVCVDCGGKLADQLIDAQDATNMVRYTLLKLSKYGQQP